MILTRSARGAAAALLFVAAASLPIAGWAHPLAPAVLELRQLTPDRVAATWTQPRRERENLRPLLPARCAAESEPALATEGDLWRVRWTARCPGGLAGAVLAVEGLSPGGAPAVVRIVRLDGDSDQWLLTADAPATVIPAAHTGSALAVAIRFLSLGAEHLLGGADHLAFLLGLFLLVRRRRTLLVAVTAFTIGHSVTLSLAVLGYFPLPSAVVEMGIALSILVLALELARGAQGSTFSRRPWLVTLGFGLLHGAGFAAALHTAGLPRSDLALALASFNLGIELAQVAVLLLLVAVRALYRLSPASLPAWVERLPAEALGALAAFWVLSRCGAML